MCGGSSMLWFFFFFSSRRRHTRCSRDWSSDVCSSDLLAWPGFVGGRREAGLPRDPFEWLLPRPRLARLAALRRGSHQRRRRKSFPGRSEEHTSELQSRLHLVCRLLLEKKKKINHSLIHKARPI